MNEQVNNDASKSTGASPLHGANGTLSTHEVLSGMIGGINQYVFYRNHVQDPLLQSIISKQYEFMCDEYNITVQAYKTGQDPAHPTRSYNMNMSHDVHFGLTTSEPKKPMTTADSLDDATISGILLGVHKSGAAAKTAAALECSSPVLRRVLQDSIANCIEMAYELALYQNKMGFYEIPQLSPYDSAIMLNKYGETSGTNNMQN